MCLVIPVKMTDFECRHKSGIGKRYKCPTGINALKHTRITG